MGVTYFTLLYQKLTFKNRFYYYPLNNINPNLLYQIYSYILFFLTKKVIYSLTLLICIHSLIDVQQFSVTHKYRNNTKYARSILNSTIMKMLALARETLFFFTVKVDRHVMSSF